jgi:hypothetical protein
VVRGSLLSESPVAVKAPQKPKRSPNHDRDIGFALETLTRETTAAACGLGEAYLRAAFVATSFAFGTLE